MCGTAWEWFSSYLSDRCQAVKIGSILSEFKELLFGVPQGSVLGPLLFSLYTTPLTKIISKYPGIKFHFYADDISNESASANLKNLNDCLNDVRDWMTSSKLKLNPDKTEFIVFGSQAQRSKLKDIFPVNILDNLLHSASVVCNLGVLMDNDFSFTAHVQSICKVVCPVEGL